MRLLIDNHDVDIDQNTQITLNYADTDVTNPSNTRISYSKSIELPGTPNNNRLFGRLFDPTREVVDSDDSFIGINFDSKKKIPATILGDSDERLDYGYLSMDSVSKTGDVVKYSLTFYSELGQFFYNLGYQPDTEDERKMSDLYFGFTSNNKTSVQMTKEQEDNYFITWDANYIKNSWEEMYDQEKINPNVIPHQVTSDGKWVYSIGQSLTACPVYQGTYEDFDNDKMLYFDDGTGPVRYLGIHGADAMTNATNSNHWFKLTATRELIEWETNSLRPAKQRPALSIPAFIDAISKPENNGGFRMDWSAVFDHKTGFYTSKLFRDGFIVGKPYDFEDEDIIAEQPIQYAQAVGMSHFWSSEDQDPIFQPPMIQYCLNPQNYDCFGKVGLFNEFGYGLFNTTNPDADNTIHVNFHPKLSLLLWWFTEGTHKVWGNTFAKSQSEVKRNGKKYKAVFHKIWTHMFGLYLDISYMSGGTKVTTYSNVIMLDTNQNEYMSPYKEDIRQIIYDNYYSRHRKSGMPHSVTFVDTNMSMSSEKDSTTGLLNWYITPSDKKNGWEMDLKLFKGKLDDIDIKVKTFLVPAFLTIEESDYKYVTNNPMSQSDIENCLYWRYSDDNPNYGTTFAPFTIQISTDVHQSYVYQGGSDPVYNPTSLSKKYAFGSFPSPYNALMMIAKPLNLRFLYDDDENVIKVLPKKNYYRKELFDLSDNIDYSKEMTITPFGHDKRFFKFGFEDSDNYASQLFKRKNDKLEYGTYKVDTKYSFNNETEDIFESVGLSSVIPYQLSSQYFGERTSNIPQLQSKELNPIFSSPTVELTYLKPDEKGVMQEQKSNVYGSSTLYNFMYAIKNDDATPKICLFDKDNSPVDVDYFLCYRGFRNETENTRRINIINSLPIEQEMNDGKNCHIGVIANKVSDINENAEIRAYNSLSARSKTVVGYSVRPINFLPYHKEYGATEFDETLDFLRPDETFMKTNIAYPSDIDLYSKFWKDYISDVYDKDSKFIELYCFLDSEPKEALRRFYYFMNSIWVINQITDYDARGNQLTKVKFLKVKSVNNYIGEGGLQPINLSKRVIFE